MRIRVFLCSLCMAAITLASAAGPPEEETDSGDTVYLRITTLPNANDPHPYAKAERRLARMFQERYPWVKLRRATGLQLPQAMQESGDYLAIAGEVGPDVYFLFLRKVPNYFEQGFLMELDRFIEAEGPGFIESLGIPDQLWPVVYRNGHYYGLIKSYYVMGLAYRRDLFREAGLPDRAPRTWEELYYFAQKTTYPRKRIKRAQFQRGQYGFALYGGYLGGWIWTNFVWSAGGDMVRWYYVTQDGQIIEHVKEVDPSTVINPDTGKPLSWEEVKWRATYNEPPAVMALNFWKALRWNQWTRCPIDDEPIDLLVYDWETGEPHRIEDPVCRMGHHLFPEDVDTPEERQAFLKELERNDLIYTGVVRPPDDKDKNAELLLGELAMNVTIPTQELLEAARASGLSLNSIGYASMPAGPGGSGANFIGGEVYAISSQIKDPRKVDAAWKFIRFMCSEEAQRIRTETFVQNGYAMYVKPDDLLKFGYLEYYRETPEEVIEAYRDMERRGRVEPTCPNYQNVQTAELAIPIDHVMQSPDADAKAELDASVAKVDRFIFSEIPPERMRRYRIIGGFLVVVIGGLVSAGFVRAIRGVAQRYGLESARFTRVERRKQIVAWVLMAPALLTIIVWQYVPLLRGSVMAFFDYRLLQGISRETFVGIDNFILGAISRDFWATLLRTVYYVTLSLGLGFLAPIFLALMLSEVPRGKLFFRTIYYLPAVTTGAVTMFLWKSLLLDPTEVGLLNHLIAGAADLVERALHWFGEALAPLAARLDSETLAAQAAHLSDAIVRWGPIQWLNSPRTAMLSIVLAGIWAGVGPGSIIYLAALKCIPEEMYEAADIDGAGIRHKIFHVTLPTIKPLVIINFVGAFIASFKAMENVLIMTGGGPGQSTTIIGIYIWRNAFLYLKFGYATALAWILGAMLIGFTLYQLRILKQVEFTTAERT